jgi:hypothetical protein
MAGIIHPQGREGSIGGSTERSKEKRSDRTNETADDG